MISATTILSTALLAAAGAAAPADPGEPAGRAPAAGEVRAVRIDTAGSSVDGRYRPASSGRGRGVLLIGANAHPLDETDAFAERLRQSGYSVLAMEYPTRIHEPVTPGHLPTLNPYGMGNSSLPKVMRDASYGYAWLAKAPDADSASVLLAGVGLGANVAAMLAGHSAKIEALVLIDPGRSCDPMIARDALAGFRGRPALLVSRATDAAFRQIFLEPGDPMRATLDADAKRADGLVSGTDEIPQFDRIVDWALVHFPATRPRE